MQKISKINKINPVKKQQEKNEYKKSKKKNTGFKEALKNEEEKLENKPTEQVRKRAIDAYKVQIDMSMPKRNRVNNIPNININLNDEKEEENTLD